VKPTFKGKLNLTKGDQEGDFGPVKTYDFSVSFKTPATGEQKERKPREKGVPFEKHIAAKVDDDDGFEVVKGKNERKQRKPNRNHSSDSDKEPGDGTKITRGDARGARGGRGGFFKNSKRGGDPPAQ
jgi:hypothetical protein